MTSEQLRALQGPLKQRYRDNPASARVTSFAEVELVPGDVAVRTRPRPTATAGLAPATGGDGSVLCSTDMLLEAAATCAGVTLMAVATAMAIPVRGGVVRAEGDWDARGTLAVDREAPVGLTAVRLVFRLETDAAPAQREKLLQLAERYCVVAQTLRAGVPVTTTLEVA